MSNSTYIEMEDDVREDIGESLPSAPKKTEKRVEGVQPAPQEEKATPDNFKYNIGDIIKVNDPDTNLLSPYGDKEYHDNLRVIFRFYDGNHVYIVEADDGIALILPEYQAELVERSTAPNTPPDNAPYTVNSRLLDEDTYKALCRLGILDTAKVAMRLAMAERVKTITQTAMREKISPIVSQMTALIAEAFQVGFDAGMECGRYTDYNAKED